MTAYVVTLSHPDFPDDYFLEVPGLGYLQNNTAHTFDEARMRQHETLLGVPLHKVYRPDWLSIYPEPKEVQEGDD